MGRGQTLATDAFTRVVKYCRLKSDSFVDLSSRNNCWLSPLG